MSYTLRLDRQVAKFLSKLRDKRLKKRLDEAIFSLQDTPFPPGCKKMIGSEERYRVRVGDYRIIYDIVAAEVMILIVAVGNRRDVYR